jgi:hypothetical protein
VGLLTREGNRKTCKYDMVELCIIPILNHWIIHVLEIRSCWTFGVGYMSMDPHPK